MRIALAFITIVFLIYAPTLGFPFFFDDSHYISRNLAIQTPNNLLNLWTSASYYSVTPENWGYRPFTTFLQSLAWLTAGGALWPFHLLKIVLHGLTCFLLFLVWKKLFAVPGFFSDPAPTLRWKWKGHEKKWTLDPGNVAFIAALFFAAHTANTEVMIYISATSTLLAGTCYIAAYYLYLCDREKPNVKFVVGSLVFYALSVLAKEEGITLVAVIVLTELFLPRRPGRIKLIALYAVLGGLMGLLLSQKFAQSSDIARGDLSRWKYFITQWRAYLRYLRLFVWPSGMNADNLAFGFSTTLADPAVIGALIGNLAIVGFVWVKRNRYPILLFSLLWFFIAISPASSVVTLAEPVNDHRMYIGYFGLLGAVVLWFVKGVDRAFRKREVEKNAYPISGVVVAAAFLALLISTEVRSQAWRSQESLWGDTVEKNPKSGRALNNLAIVYMGNADWERVGDLLRRCEEYAPAYPICRINQAIFLAATGKEAEAERKFQDTIAYDSQRPNAKIHYAEFLSARGRYQEAIQLYREVDEMISGVDLNIKLAWAGAAIETGRWEEAKTVLLQANRLFRGDARVNALLLRVGIKP